jgi:hypothetical protein
MPDPATALAEHKKHCPHCRAEITRPGAPWCSERIELAKAWRESLRDQGSEPVPAEKVREDGEP